MPKRTIKTRDMHVFMHPEAFEMLDRFAKERGLNRSSALEMLVRDRMREREKTDKSINVEEK